MREQKQASTNKINLLLLMPFACTTRIKEISPQPWPSPPELCSHSCCTQGPSSGSPLCRTRGREGDLHVLPKVGSFQPPTPQEFPLASCSLLSSFLATQGSGSWPFCIYVKTLLITLFILLSNHHFSPLLHLVPQHLDYSAPPTDEASLVPSEAKQHSLQPRPEPPHPLSGALSGQGLWCAKDTVSSSHWPQHMACHCATQPSVKKVQALPTQPAMPKALI